jgi:NADH-ubiquinone oxidoreductase chain 5
MRYVNMFGFVLLFMSTGLTDCYSFRLFYFVFCGDFLSPLILRLKLVII